MRINEKGTNMIITGDIKDYLYKKLGHLERFLNPTDESILCEVELGKTTNHHKAGEVFRTEINLHIAGNNFRAEAQSEDLLASIDIAKDEMVRKIQTNKDKRVSLIRRSGAKIKNLIKGIFVK
ncbi:MAG: ribosomal subunit interface protein [Candidatus Taylorbacteria bacterium RIFOXYD2_FULL_36_9]|uniref:Ribosomal subunit interface protein n=1 Tax=Candidatus Taylorbacteria bacterium RIFOXYD2_FULL_36_9 TaxID=1802338 RepID=A0A1G2PF76_9BACT|nr:MAG: ribosomal subunit interface protein [Candidatus Taylorbacteria bacterium RIFOXYD2_FULL_36_9]